jgi:hypothetical protein
MPARRCATGFCGRLTGIGSTLSSAADAHPVALKAPAIRRVSGWTVAAVVALLPAIVVYARPIRTAPNYDEEVYLATMRELHHGVAIGPVFLSQPPGFGWLLDAIGWTTASISDVRAVMIGFSLFACVAAWTLGRRVGGPLGGAIAAGTLAIAPPWPAMATRLEAEVPSTYLAVCALALAEPFPLAAGAAFALAVSIKLYAASAAVPLVLLARRRLGSLALGAAIATAAVALSVVTHLGDVWNDAFLFHLKGRGEAGPISDNVHRVVHFFDLRTPFSVVAAVAIGAAIVAVALRRPWPITWALWTWPPAAALALIGERPIFDHSLELLAAAWALPIGVTLAAATANTTGRARLAVGAATVITVTGALVQQWSHLGPVRPKPDVRAAVHRLRAFYPPGTLVASDHQIFPYLAHDREPPQLVDISAVRIASGNLTTAALLRDSRDAKAFVVGRALSDDQPVLAALARRYRQKIVIGTITIFADPR